MSKNERKDLIGQNFGNYKVVEKIEQRKGYWLCLCQCGEYREVRGSHLVAGDCKSCGCHRYRDLLNQKFIRLTVVNYLGREGKNNIWECLCECGNIKITNSHNLLTGQTRSCGCLRNDRVKEVCTTHGLRGRSEDYNPAYYPKEKSLFFVKKKFKLSNMARLKREKSR